MDPYIVYGLGLIAAFSSAATAWVAGRKFNESQSALEDAYTKLSKRVAELEDEREDDYKRIVEMRAELDAARAMTSKLKTETAALRQGVVKLIKQLRAQNIPPAWTPEDFTITED